MPYNYSKLIGRMAEKGKSRKETAREGANISPQSFFKKLSNRTSFNQNQINGICAYLEIPLNEIPDYFFCWLS